MLTCLKIQNFKCFNELSLQLAPLTLLTGFNAAGKSTAIQSLLLFAQALRYNDKSSKIPLNGTLVCLGTPGEVLYSGSGDVAFNIEDNQCNVEWILHPDDRTKGNALRIKQIKINDEDVSEKNKNFNHLDRLLPREANKNAKDLVKHLREIVFLSAIRIGTADVFPTPNGPSPSNADVGLQGEFAPWLFERNLDETIDQSRLNPSDPANTMRRQFNAWANDLFPGAQGNAERIDKTSLLRLELRIGDKSDWRRPSNIGYGLTYAFPVIVSALLARKDHILIIDSPEAHLHPLGQSKMGHFLAKMSAAGVQIIIETHSDHILNGIRLAVQKAVVKPEKVAIHFFNHPMNVSKGNAQVQSPLIDSQGNLSEWPDGFFDQAENDLARLAGWF